MIRAAVVARGGCVRRDIRSRTSRFAHVDRRITSALFPFACAVIIDSRRSSSSYSSARLAVSTPLRSCRRGVFLAAATTASTSGGAAHPGTRCGAIISGSRRRSHVSSPGLLSSSSCFASLIRDVGSVAACAAATAAATTAAAGSTPTSSSSFLHFYSTTGGVCPGTLLGAAVSRAVRRGGLPVQRDKGRFCRGVHAHPGGL